MDGVEVPDGWCGVGKRLCSGWGNGCVMFELSDSRASVRGRSKGGDRVNSAIWVLLTGPLDNFTPDLVLCPAHIKQKARSFRIAPSSLSVDA